MENKIKTIIGVYGPSEDALKANNEEFWNKLKEETDKSKGEIYILGDLNGRVGRRDENYRDPIGRYGEQHRNNNGKRIIKYCIEQDLIITNTYFKHKDIHKYTREQASKIEKSIIDNILTGRKNRGKVKDVRVKRGFKIGSDYYLLIANIEQDITIQEDVKGKEKTYTKEI